jgi:hypothetical protein
MPTLSEQFQTPVEKSLKEEQSMSIAHKYMTDNLAILYGSVVIKPDLLIMCLKIQKIIKTQEDILSQQYIYKDFLIYLRLV